MGSEELIDVGSNAFEGELDGKVDGCFVIRGMESLSDGLLERITDGSLEGMSDRNVKGLIDCRTEGLCDGFLEGFLDILTVELEGNEDGMVVVGHALN